MARAASRLSSMTDRTPELEQAQFISMVGHELKNPLAVIKSFSQLLRRRLEEHQDERAIQQLDRIEAKTDELTLLVTMVSEIVKLRAGVLKLAEDEVLLLDPIQTATKRVHAGLGFPFEIAADQATAQVRVKLDATRFEFMFEQLLRALVKAIAYEEDETATQAVPVTVAVALLSGESNQQLAQVSIYKGTEPPVVTFYERGKPEKPPAVDIDPTSKNIFLLFAAELIRHYGGELAIELGTSPSIILILPSHSK
jgi:hypothetical protein